MRKNNRFVFFSFFIILAYLISACSGVSAGQNINSNDRQSQSGETREVVFTGIVDSIGNGQWAVDGQFVTVDSSTSVDASIVVGDKVKVDAVVSQGGSVTATRIGLAVDNNSNSNDNSANVNDSNTNSNDSNASSNNNGNANGNDSSSGMYPEITGVVDAITADSITIDDATYALSSSTVYKDQVAVGDQVKIQVVVNSDGTFTVREIGVNNGTQMDNGNHNSNSNINGSDDDYSNTNVNSNYNGSGNDDHRGSNSNNNGNGSYDDNGGSGGDD